MAKRDFYEVLAI